ncbi:MAG: type II toxin-antitoxin system RelE/ParE family toxin [Bryobacterales bacterium]|nr:type II toxin-antitoxin system RelE/ParE family toxin [Bryobacterales bacterium]
MKRIVLSDEAKADIRAIPQHIAMNILTAIHRLAETGAGRVKELKGEEGEKRLRVGDFRVRFTEEQNGVLRIYAVRLRLLRCGRRLRRASRV